MTSFGIAIMKRTCAAFAVRLGRRPTASSMLLITAAPMRGGPSLVWTSRIAKTRLMSSSNFKPPIPPGTHGTPVFKDIDFSVASSPESAATQRNSDPGAVFVVTGSNRGIGFQFIKSLVERTKVWICFAKASVAFISSISLGPFTLTLLILFLGDGCRVLSVTRKCY